MILMTFTLYAENCFFKTVTMGIIVLLQINLLMLFQKIIQDSIYSYIILM